MSASPHEVLVDNPARHADDLLEIRPVPHRCQSLQYVLKALCVFPGHPLSSRPRFPLLDGEGTFSGGGGGGIGAVDKGSGTE